MLPVKVLPYGHTHKFIYEGCLINFARFSRKLKSHCTKDLPINSSPPPLSLSLSFCLKPKPLAARGKAALTLRGLYLNPVSIITQLNVSKSNK